MERITWWTEGWTSEWAVARKLAGYWDRCMGGGISDWLRSSVGGPAAVLKSREWQGDGKSRAGAE